MPAVDTPYIIGVIRTFEKRLLQADEYTRIIEADSATQAANQLLETPYGPWLTPGAGAEMALKAVEERLSDLMNWIAEHVVDDEVAAFLQTRYDGLNMASGLMEWATGKQEPGRFSQLGSIRPEALHSTIWHDVGWEELPEEWESFGRALRKELDTEERAENWKYQLLEQTAKQQFLIERSLAKTELMVRLAQLHEARWRTDRFIRGEGPLPTSRQEQRAYPTFSSDAPDYERAWDNLVLDTVRAAQYEVIGYDPIIAFWYAVEIEAKTIRLLLTGKTQSLPTDQVREMVRNTYRP